MLPVDFDHPTSLNVGDFLSVKIERLHTQSEIKHSDWVNSFAPKLGLGNFLLVELHIPNQRQIAPPWDKLYNVLAVNVKDMEKSIREGDWQKTMLFGRKFFENLKVGDDKPGHKSLKKELDHLLKIDQYDEEGIQNLHNGIWQFFEFISKFIHDKDKKGNLRTLPIPTKEEAYLAYSLALSLLNLIGKKLDAENR